MNGMFGDAVAGLAGTAVMSLAMAGAKAAGLLPGETPPRRVSRNVEKALGLSDERSPTSSEAGWIGQHFAFGATAGVAYGLVERRLPLREPLLVGPLYGAALWAFSYAGWLPATGLYPPPDVEPKRRVASMIAAHLIYGTVTAAVASTLDAGPGPVHPSRGSHAGWVSERRLSIPAGCR